MGISVHVNVLVPADNCDLVRIADCTIGGRDGDKTYRAPIVVEKNCPHVMAVNNFLGRGSEGNFELPKGTGTASGNVMV